MKPPILIAALALTLPLAGTRAVTFTSNTTIGVGDTTYDGQDIVGSGCTLTVNGPHRFASSFLTSDGALAQTSATPTKRTPARVSPLPPSRGGALHGFRQRWAETALREGLR